MKLYEYEGVELFKQGGIPVPDFAVVNTAAEARKKAEIIGVPVIIKAQVLTGGRYLAGGVRTVDSLDKVEETAGRILSSKIRGLPVNKVMIAANVNVVREYYCSITIDDYHGTPLVIFSAEGGVDINQIAQEKEEAVAQKAVRISKGLTLSDARKMCRQVGLKGKDLEVIPGIMEKLYQVFRNNDAILAEINPLVRTRKGDYVALDSKIEMDDSGLYRHTDLGLNQLERITNPLEKAGREIGVSYLELDGDIAIIASGAGLGMASMDIISKRMNAANFLETGGAITEELLYKVMDLVFRKEGIRGLFINVYGGINPIHEGAKGVVRYLKDHNITIPVVAKALGNHQEETWQIFKENGVHVTTGVSTEEGVEMLADLVEGRR
ncbi:MAG: acetate--CoA ligase family protein [Dehalococcoidales bacterium]|nr:MAG: acetate--CoA ligase family protein [Dehalococcoidales bacterium]